MNLQPPYVHREWQSYPTRGTIVEISSKRHWTALFRKVPVYTILVDYSHLRVDFVDQNGKQLTPPTRIQLIDKDNNLSGKQIGDELEIMLDYADKDKQFFDRVPAFQFTIAGNQYTSRL